MIGGKRFAEFSKSPQKKWATAIYYNHQKGILREDLTFVHYVVLSTQCTNISSYKTQNT